MIYDLEMVQLKSKLKIFTNAIMIYEPWAVARFLESRMGVEASLSSISRT